MAGGTWTAQTKVRPGVYIRFKTAFNGSLNVGDRGVVAICEPLSWGPVGAVQTINAGDSVTPYTGYEITEPQSRFLNEIFKGTGRSPAPKTVLLYRPSANGSAQAAVTVDNLTATARYPGVRGNDITITVTESVDVAGSYTVSTIVSGIIMDSQVGGTVADLVDNDWVSFTGTGSLSPSTGAALTGGANGTVQSAAYSAFLSNIEPYKFDVLIYDGTDTIVAAAYVTFIKRIAEENGQYAQLVAAGLSAPDSRYVVNVQSGVTLEDGTALTAQQVTWWAGGVLAAASYNESLTYATYPGAIAVNPMRTNSQMIDMINSGGFVLYADGGTVRIETDINSLVTYTQDIGKVYRYNRTMRLCNTVANDIYAQFAANYIGVVDNNGDGRLRFKAAVVGYLLEIQANNGIQNFTADDVEVSVGEELDGIVIDIALQVVGTVEKIYVTVEIS